MAEEGKVKGFIVNSDSDLIKKFSGCIEEIQYIKPNTIESFKNIKPETSLNYQNKELLESWMLLLGDAIVFLKGKDEREVIHDDMRLGLGKLYSYIKEYRDFEPIFYGGKDDYRDHIEHVFRTFLLGDYLIRNSFGYENIEPINEELPVSKDEKEAMWCIIALCHDIGYPIQTIQDLNDPIRSLLKIFGNTTISEFGYTYYPQFLNISEFAIKFISSQLIPIDPINKNKEDNKNKDKENNNKKEGDKKIKKNRYVTHIQPKYYQKFSSAFSNYNHGVISAILLMKDLVYFKESDYTLDRYKSLNNEDSRQFMIRNNIVRSIASHSCKDIYYLKGTDFPFLLKAFDEMQEWGRPRLRDILERSSIKRLIVNEFSKNYINYTIAFEVEEDFPEKASDEEKKEAQKGAKNYFKTKCGEWLNVLRSAVGGDERELKLEFIVEGNIPPEKKVYKLNHPNPRDLTIEPDDVKKEIMKEIMI